MSGTGSPQRDEMWFMNTRVIIHASHRGDAGEISALENLAPRGDSPPLHVHHGEGEVFHVIEGELRVVVDGRESRIGAGETAYAPMGAAHTYRVESDQARFLTVLPGGEFERYVRAAGSVPEHDGLPTPSGPPTDEQIRERRALAQQHGIEFVGPPLS